jgi:hypothetical protein
MNQPLVSRPPYGGGNFGSPQAEAKLPEGSPAGKGVSLDSDISGYKTYAKPVDDIRTTPKNDGSMFRVDGPDDIPKEQTTPDSNDTLMDARPSFNEGIGEQDSPKTKFPYRDGIPNAHNASAEFVVALWGLQKSPVRLFWTTDGVKVAATPDAILMGLDDKTTQRAQACTAKLKRADVKNLRWIFSVDCGNGLKAVKFKAMRPRANTTAFGKLNLEISCSCNAWRWLGPEYHAKSEAYLLGKPQGTASTPDIKDPERVHRVCKHVAAALLVARGWVLPKAT